MISLVVVGIDADNRLNQVLALLGQKIICDVWPR